MGSEMCIRDSGKSPLHFGFVAVANSLLLEHLEGDAKQVAIDKAVEATRRMIRSGYQDFVGLRKTELEFMPLHSYTAYQEMLDDEEERLKAVATKTGDKS